MTAIGSQYSTPLTFHSTDEKDVCEFAAAIQQDSHLHTLLNALIKTLSVQIERIEEHYFYDALAYGDFLESLSEQTTHMKVEEAIDTIYELAEHSYYQENKLQYSLNSNDKVQHLRNVCFVSVLDLFEETIHALNLNRDEQWSVLAKRIFNSNLHLKK